MTQVTRDMHRVSVLRSKCWTDAVVRHTRPASLQPLFCAARMIHMVQPGTNGASNPPNTIRMLPLHGIMKTSPGIPMTNGSISSDSNTTPFMNDAFRKHILELPSNPESDIDTIDAFSRVVSRSQRVVESMDRKYANVLVHRIAAGAVNLIRRYNQGLPIAVSSTSESVITKTHEPSTQDTTSDNDRVDLYRVLDQSMDAMHALVGLCEDPQQQIKDVENVYGMPVWTCYQKSIEPILEWMHKNADGDVERMLRVHVLRWQACHDALNSYWKQTDSDKETKLSHLPLNAGRAFGYFKWAVPETEKKSEMAAQLVNEMAKCLSFRPDPIRHRSQSLVLVLMVIRNMADKPAKQNNKHGLGQEHPNKLPQALIDSSVLAIRDQAQIAVGLSKECAARHPERTVELSQPDVLECVRLMVDLCMKLEKMQGPIGLHAVINEVIPYADLAVKPAQIMTWFRAQRQIALFGRPVGNWSKKFIGGEAAVKQGQQSGSPDRSDKSISRIRETLSENKIKEVLVPFSTSTMDVVVRSAAKVNDLGIMKIGSRILHEMGGKLSRKTLGELMDYYWRERAARPSKANPMHIVHLYENWMDQTFAGVGTRYIRILAEILVQHPKLSLHVMNRVDSILEKEQERGLDIPDEAFAALIAAYGRLHDSHKVLELYKMAVATSARKNRRLGNIVTIAAAWACVRQGQLQRAIDILDAGVHEHGQREGIRSMHVRMAVAEQRCDISEMETQFMRMQTLECGPDETVYRTLMRGCLRAGRVDAAVGWYERLVGDLGKQSLNMATAVVALEVLGRAEREADAALGVLQRVDGAGAERMLSAAVERYWGAHAGLLRTLAPLISRSKPPGQSRSALGSENSERYA